MKVLVFSDSHGRKDLMTIMMNREKDCEKVFCLGDGLKEALTLPELYPEKQYVFVRGNNDFGFSQESEAYQHIDGVTFMACHGHLFDVRYTLTSLLDKAAGVMAQVALYGHTHRHGMYHDPVTGVCAVNPGALCDGRYCIITVEKGTFDLSFRSVW